MEYLSPGDQRRFITQLKRHEGAVRDASGRHKPYRCSAGALTIGYGHNLDANPVPGIGPDSRLTDEQAERLLMADLGRFAGELGAALPWALNLDAPRYAVLLNMQFNLGTVGLLGFRNTLGMIQRGQYVDAAAGMLNSKWARQVKGRARELAKQMATGAWQ